MAPKVKYETSDLNELSVIATALWQLKTGGTANATELGIADRLYEEVHEVIDTLEGRTDWTGTADYNTMVAKGL